MLLRSIRASRGTLEEPSVVQSPRAKLFAGVPNSALGIAYFVALPALVWSSDSPVARDLALAAALAAAATSAYLAYSLLFVTRRGCKYCWIGHAANWALAACVVLLFFVR